MFVNTFGTDSPEEVAIPIPLLMRDGNSVQRTTELCEINASKNKFTCFRTTMVNTLVIFQ